jgi:hypothetical protein
MSAGAATPPGMGQIESRLGIGMCRASILHHPNFRYAIDTNACLPHGPPWPALDAIRTHTLTS